MVWRAPDIRPLSAWVEAGWEAQLLAGEVPGPLLNRAQARRLWSQVLLPEIEPAEPLLQLVEQAWRLLHDWGISLDDVSRHGSGADTASFQRWARRYSARCAEAAWVDSVVAMGRLATTIRRGPDWLPRRLLFVGFEVWTPALQELATALQDAGCRAEPVALSVAGAAEPRRIEFPDEASEFDAAADWLVARAMPDGNHCLAIVVPELAGAGAALRRRLLDRLQPGWRDQARTERPVTGGDEAALASLGPVHAALLSLELAAETIDYQAMGQLLRSPFLGGGDAETDGRARLDRWLRERGERSWEFAVVRQRAAELAPNFATRLRRFASQGPAGARSPAAWATWIGAQLAVLGWPGEGRQDADAALAIDGWQDLLDAFGSCSPVTGNLSYTAARRMLGAMARERSAPLPGRGGGVLVLSPGEALGQCFDALWFAGLHAEAWPPPMHTNPLVPVNLQRRAGVPDAAPASHARQARKRLDQLLSAAAVVRVSAAHRRGDEVLTPSPVLARSQPLAPSDPAAARLPAPSERIAWTRELETVPDAPPALSPGTRGPGGVRLLQLEAVCPARAFFELRLHARELPVPAVGIDAAGRGRLVHAAVEELYRALQVSRVAPGSADALELVPEVVRDCLRGCLAPTDLNRVLETLEARRLEAILGALLAFDTRRPAFRIVDTETALRLVVGGLELELRADRIDALAAGGQLVIDYKTGARKSRTQWLGNRPSEPQLPAYALGSQATAVAFIRLSGEGVQADGVAADDTEIDGIRTVAQLTRGRLGDWQALRAEWQTALESLAAEFVAGCCRIDGLATALADGQFAPLTRVHDRRSDP